MLNKVNNKTAFILIAFISIISAGQILRLYFSYEDFATFYALQFPHDASEVILSPKLSKHHSLYWIFPLFFKYLGYNPFGYYLFALVLFVVYNFFYYLLLKKIFPNDQRLALFATLLQASVQVGLDGFVWNMSVGPEILLFLISTVITFYVFLKHLEKPKIITLLLLFIVYSFTVYYFPFRSFFLFGWLPLFALFVVKKKKKSTFTMSLILTALGVVFISGVMNRLDGDNTAVGIDMIYLAKVFFKNLSYLFPFYNILIKPFNSGLLLLARGIIIFAVMFLTPIFLLKKNRQISMLAFFFSFSLLASLVLMIAATIFDGQVALVWQKDHWFYLTMLPMLAGFLAVFLIGLQKRFKSFNPLIIVILLVVVNIFLTNKGIMYRVDNHSNPLRFFYSNIKKVVPTLTKDDLIVMNINGSPRPLNPFISGINFDGSIYLAGFYHIKFKDLNCAFSPIEAVKILVDRGIDLNNVYSVDFTKDNLKDETSLFREILRTGKTVNLLDNKTEQEIEIKDLDLSTATPLYLEINAAAKLLDIAPKPIAEGDKEYLDVIISQMKKQKFYSVTTDQDGETVDQTITHVIDNDYGSVWIPSDWTDNGVEFVLDLGQELNINKIVWSSSRTAPWFLRSVFDYSISVSRNGENYDEVTKNQNAKYLERGEFFVDEFETITARYIKFDIYKTHGGWTPAVDEVEVFEESEQIDNYKKYFDLKENAIDYLPNRAYVEKYLTEALGNEIPMTIYWMNEYNESYSTDNVANFLFDSTNKNTNYKILIPRTGREIKLIKIESDNFPVSFKVNSINAVYPSLNDFKNGKISEF